mmetsp:Transcript_13342/g.22710  ORF Transcript_13342/g.22710 Transcript_13342/m.22710 type:complete len:87 (+) Transcript_13342:1009-1269(+)
MTTTTLTTTMTATTTQHVCTTFHDSTKTTNSKFKKETRQDKRLVFNNVAQQQQQQQHTHTIYTHTTTSLAQHGRHFTVVLVLGFSF